MGRKGFSSAHRSQFIFQGGQSTDSHRNHGVIIEDFFLALPASFLIQPRPTCLGIPPSTVCWALLHQLAIKKVPLIPARGRQREVEASMVYIEFQDWQGYTKKYSLEKNQRQNRIEENKKKRKFLTLMTDHRSV